MKERYIIFHITELIEIGKACVPHIATNPDFIRVTCARFMNNRSNFRITLSLLLESENPMLLFSSDGANLRSEVDIIHLFLCMFEYFDCFDGCLRKVLNEMVTRKIDNPAIAVLVSAIHTMVLTTDQDWQTLDHMFQHPQLTTEPKKISGTSLELFAFCKAIYGYAAGLLYSNASWYKESRDKTLIVKRKEALDNAVNSLKLKHLSPATDVARKYFSIHVLIAKAEAIWAVNRCNVTVIKEAFSLCKRAKKYTEQVLILEPR